MSYDEGWRNRSFRGAPYEQYCFPDELIQFRSKLLYLIERYGSAFDDHWQYKKSGRTQVVVVRTPLWLGKKFFFRECEKVLRRKPRRDPFQKKLKHVYPVKEE